MYDCSVYFVIFCLHNFFVYGFCFGVFSTSRTSNFIYVVIIDEDLRSCIIEMVNYCSVSGCGRNSKTSKHLFYYGVPKDKPRQEQWLRAIGREDLLEKNLKKLSYRVCSRHFSPSSIKNKHLCADAMPTLCLPGDKWEEPPVTEVLHNDIACNSCSKVILGYRYKCITCLDYDLCSKCEMFEVHPDHFMMRIPKPVNFKVADDLMKKWQKLVNIEQVSVASRTLDSGSSDDDLPITKYVKQTDSGVELPEDMKTKIRNEVTRILAIKHVEPRKRKKESKKKEDYKKKKIVDKEDKSCGTEDLESLFPEVVFADVNEIGGSQILEVKHEMPSSLTAPLEERHQPMTDLNFSDSDFLLTSLS